MAELRDEALPKSNALNRLAAEFRNTTVRNEEQQAHKDDMDALRKSQAEAEQRRLAAIIEELNERSNEFEDLAGQRKRVIARKEEIIEDLREHLENEKDTAKRWAEEECTVATDLAILRNKTDQEREAMTDEMSELDAQAKSFADAASKASHEAKRKDEEIGRLLEELQPFANEAEEREQARSEAYNEERTQYEAQKLCNMCRTAAEQCRFPKQHRVTSWIPQPKRKMPFKKIESPSHSTQLLLSLSPKLMGITTPLDLPGEIDVAQQHPSVTVSKLPSLPEQRCEQSGVILAHALTVNVATKDAQQRGSDRQLTCAF